MRLLLAVLALVSLNPLASFAGNGVERGLIIVPGDNSPFFSPMVKNSIHQELARICNLMDAQGKPMNATLITHHASLSNNMISFAGDLLLFNDKGAQVDAVKLNAEVAGQEPDGVRIRTVSDNDHCF